MRIWLVGMLAFGLAGGSAAFAQPRAMGPAPVAAPLHVTRNTSLKIPFSVEPGDTPDSEPVWVQVLVSVDQGRSWRNLSQHRPNEKQFPFEAKRDGEYWLATRSLDRDNRPTPAGDPTPQLRLLIDREQPRLNLTAEVSPSGELLLTFQATDERLDPTSFRLECQTGGAKSTWNSVSIDSRDISALEGGLQGKTTYKPPPSARSVTVRAEVRDKAKNVTTASRQVFLPLAGSGVAGSPGSSLRAMTPIEAQPLSSNPGATPNSQEQTSAPSSQSPTQEQTGSGAFGDANSATKAGPGRLAAYPREREDQSSESPRHVEGAAAPPAIAKGAEVDPYSDQPRLINKKRFNLEYDVESVGVSGVAEVELWGTTDRGQTWARWGADPDLKSPMEVDVNNEAVYGFRIVVVGRNGLASSRPKAGDAADVWVQVDSTPPDARLTSVTYGQGEDAGKLVMQWEATDAHLSQRPVTLLMSDRPDGNFSVIAAGLANSGQYLWQYDPRAPQQLYLRLEVRDEAGNSTLHQLAEPIRVEGLTPKGRIRNVAPVESSRSPFRSPLFK